MVCLGYMIDTKFILSLRNEYLKRLIVSKKFFNFTQILDESEVINVLEIIHIFSIIYAIFSGLSQILLMIFPHPCLFDLLVIN